MYDALVPKHRRDRLRGELRRADAARIIQQCLAAGRLQQYTLTVSDGHHGAVEPAMCPAAQHEWRESDEYPNGQRGQLPMRWCDGTPPNHQNQQAKIESGYPPPSWTGKPRMTSRDRFRPMDGPLQSVQREVANRRADGADCGGYPSGHKHKETTPHRDEHDEPY